MSGVTEIRGAGERKWIYPIIRKGIYYKWRSAISYVYLIVFFAGPFIRIAGQPLLLLNFPERHFVILGQSFWPDDIFLFVLATLLFIVCIVLFTMAFGRLFCGWICPQTIFMEMVFRKVEEWIEGDAHKRRKLDEGPLTLEKFIKKSAKHKAFVIISFLIANTFLAYIIGSENLWKIITEPVTKHWVGFGAICLFTLVFYLVYSRVRELVCTFICPYGRLQNVLTDKDTLMVAYNDMRGEPRGKKSRIADPFNLKGDCVDCGLCVSACPTGIDIRNGTQIECINCTACIDVCNDVMKKIDRPTNLIGYYSENMIRKQEKPSFTLRMKGYAGVITILAGVLFFFVFTRSDVDMTVMRSAGTLYQEQPGNWISNIYTAEVINKTNTSQTITIVPEANGAKIKYIQAPKTIQKGSMTKAIFFVMLPSSAIHTPKTSLKLKLLAGGKLKQTISTTFVGPIND